MDKKSIPIIGLVVATMAAAAAMFMVSDSLFERTTAAIDVLLIGGLLAMTAFYALKTEQIAEGTKDLAKEASLQRQSDFMLIIDIKESPDPTEIIKIGLMTDEGGIPKSLTCRLSNVWRGPAFNLRYQVAYSSGVKNLVEPTFLVDHTMISVTGSRSDADRGIRESPNLALVVESGEGQEHFVRIAYQDVFGNQWESTKSFQKGESEILGPLSFHPEGSQ